MKTAHGDVFGRSDSGLTTGQIDLLERELSALLSVGEMAAGAMDREGAHGCAICTFAWDAMRLQVGRGVEAVYRACAEYQSIGMRQDRDRARALFEVAGAWLFAPLGDRRGVK